MQINEQKDFPCLIGGKQKISQDVWAISLIRKFDADHAYLIMEGIDENNNRVISDAHLVEKKTNTKKADVIYRDMSNKLEELQRIGQSCSSYTWNINRNQSDLFISLIESEKQRAGEDKINYVVFGKSRTSGFFVSLPDDAKACLGNTSDSACTDALLREGHNCGSWAIAMVRALSLPFKGDYMPFIFLRPRSEIPEGKNFDGDAVKLEPDTKSPEICLMM